MLSELEAIVCQKMNKLSEPLLYRATYLTIL